VNVAVTTIRPLSPKGLTIELEGSEGWTGVQTPIYKVSLSTETRVGVAGRFPKPYTSYKMVLSGYEYPLLKEDYDAVLGWMKAWSKFIEWGCSARERVRNSVW
jgi:hypothetical protein